MNKEKYHLDGQVATDLLQLHFKFNEKSTLYPSHVIGNIVFMCGNKLFINI